MFVISGPSCAPQLLPVSIVIALDNRLVRATDPMSACLCHRALWYCRFRMASCTPSASFPSQSFDLTLFLPLLSLVCIASLVSLYVLKCEWVPVRTVVKPSVWTGTELKSCVLSVFSQTSRMGDPRATQNQPLPLIWGQPGKKIKIKKQLVHIRLQKLWQFMCKWFRAVAFSQ